MYADEAILSALKENAIYAKPSASVLCYPVITFVDDAHLGTKQRATGGDESKNAILSPELRADKNTPIAFIWTTSEDTCVPPISSLLYAGALSKNGVPFELHVYQKGQHGMALGTEETSCNPATDKNLNLDAIEWVDKSVKFLKRNGFVCYNEE
jgi:acetyl esterase/lipase